MQEKLFILWTSGDPITAEKMVLMYAINAKTNGWWKNITLMIWGGATKLASEHEMIQEKIKMAIHTGIEVIACKGCSDQLGVSQVLENIGVDVKYIGTDLTSILKDDEKLLTI